MKKIFTLSSITMLLLSYSMLMCAGAQSTGITVDNYKSFENSNAYTLFGLPTTASDAEIAKKYRELSVQLHPDKNKGREAAATNAFQLLGKAYAKIKEPGYEREAEKAKLQPKPTPAPSTQQSPQRPTPATSAQQSPQRPAPAQQAQRKTWQEIKAEEERIQNPQILDEAREREANPARTASLRAASDLSGDEITIKNNSNKRFYFTFFYKNPIGSGIEFARMPSYGGYMWYNYWIPIAYGSTIREKTPKFKLGKARYIAFTTDPLPQKDYPSLNTFDDLTVAGTPSFYMAIGKTSDGGRKESITIKANARGTFAIENE